MAAACMECYKHAICIRIMNGMSTACLTCPRCINVIYTKSIQQQQQIWIHAAVYLDSVRYYRPIVCSPKNMDFPPG